jgi:hypothetical protein
MSLRAFWKQSPYIHEIASLHTVLRSVQGKVLLATLA